MHDNLGFYIYNPGYIWFVCLIDTCLSALLECTKNFNLNLWNVLILWAKQPTFLAQTKKLIFVRFIYILGFIVCDVINIWWSL